MKKLRIQFADVDNSGIVKRFILGVLEQRWDIEICEDPDYLFCGDFLTYEFLKYDCIKIFIGGENEYPNLNLYDYAIGNNTFFFEDRYIRWPFYLWRDGTRKKFELACRKHQNATRGGKRFCNFVVSNGVKADPYRKELFERLSQYKRVDSGGHYLNNLGQFIEDKMKFMQEYKFTIACENSMQRGYITEKIIEAWAAGTIPIYWGACDIADEFNDKAFVNCMVYQGMEEVVERVKELDCDEKKYLEVLKEPILNQNSNAVHFMDDTLLLDFFTNIFERPKEQARKVFRSARNAIIDEELKRLVKNDAYYRNFVIWNRKRIAGKYITDIPIVKKAKRIAIYGLGPIGRQLVDELIECGRDIVMIIDRNNNFSIYKGIPICTLETVAGWFQEGDVLILTIKDDQQEIVNEVRELFFTGEIIDIKQLLEYL